MTRKDKQASLLAEMRQQDDSLPVRQTLHLAGAFYANRTKKMQYQHSPEPGPEVYQKTDLLPDLHALRCAQAKHKRFKGLLSSWGHSSTSHHKGYIVNTEVTTNSFKNCNIL